MTPPPELVEELKDKKERVKKRLVESESDKEESNQYKEKRKVRITQEDQPEQSVTFRYLGLYSVGEGGGFNFHNDIFFWKDFPRSAGKTILVKIYG